jgi:hypothetical protein
LPPVAASV